MSGTIHNLAPAGWSGMEHVERRIRAHYGTDADDVLQRLRERETARHRGESLRVQTIPRGRDVFQRNLKALEYIAAGTSAADGNAVRQLYRDALADLATVHPAGEFHEIWKHVLDAARADAERKVR